MRTITPGIGKVSEAVPVTQVGIYEAKRHFSRLLRRVAAGEHIQITDHGEPVAELVAVRPARHEDDAKQAVATLLAAMPKPSSRGGIDSAELTDAIRGDRTW